MSLQSGNIISITNARGRLGDLADLAIANNYYILTKGGSPSVALVDFDYLKKLEDTVGSLYQKTYIDPMVEKYTREFTDKEMAEWQKEDQS